MNVSFELTRLGISVIGFVVGYLCSIPAGTFLAEIAQAKNPTAGGPREASGVAALIISGILGVIVVVVLLGYYFKLFYVSVESLLAVLLVTAISTALQGVRSVLRQASAEPQIVSRANLCIGLAYIALFPVLWLYMRRIP
ncbi:MAG: hypothetical protein QM758_05040 [Armatimonas sp.]